MKLRSKPVRLRQIPTENSITERTNGTIPSNASIKTGLNPRSRIEYREARTPLYTSITEVPKPVRVYYSLGFRPTGGNAEDGEGWVYGDCVVCGGVGKLYVEISTGRPSCKTCGIAGNVYAFLGSIYGRLKVETDKLDRSVWKALEKDRGIEAEFIRDSGIVYNLDQR